MLTFPRSVRIHLATQHVDFRKGHHGLCGVVRNHLGSDPLEDVWVFYNRRKTDLKVLWWDHGGFVLAHKKRSKGRYPIPAMTGSTVRLTSAELGALLEGIDLARCRRVAAWNPPDAPRA